ncbi:MAG: Crp/Fnr family transcriptional regulator, partial [Clostridiales bacterium]|nr:Crp/Fnr family transcriptional regulator [Clostridiales bacterium]
MLTKNNDDWDPEVFPIKEVDPGRCIEKLRQIGEIRSYEKDELLVESEFSESVCFVVLEGLVIAQVLTEAGTENQYINHTAGYALLEAQCFCEWTENAQFQAKEPTTAVLLTRTDLLAAVEGDPELALFFLGTLSQKFRWYIEHARNLSAHSALRRYCDLLLKMVAHDSETVDGKLRVCKKISQEEIGKKLHVNRLTVIRCMKELRGKGLIETKEDGYICIPDI